MKVVVSIPAKVLKSVQTHARRTKRSLSSFFADALKEYLARHAPNEITAAMNKVCSEIGETSDPFVSAAASITLERSER